MDTSSSSPTDVTASALRVHSGFAKRKACLQCTKSKRKCDRSLPHCLRCHDKEVVCHYPPSRRSRPIPPANSDQSSESLVGQRQVHRTGQNKSPRSTSSHRYTSLQGPRNPRTVISGPKLGEDSLANDRWFLTPDTFVKQLAPNESNPEQPLCYQDRILGDETIEFLQATKSWMEQWAREGHSPAVHRHLYSGGYMPECVEDAYTVLATYHSSTNPQVRKTALQIADRRASRLIASFNEFHAQTGFHDVCGSVVIDTRTHLGRTLALLTYQVMGLFDADIRARSNAEDYIETLNSWALQMLESARLDCLTAEMDTAPPFNVSDSAENTEAGQPNASFGQPGEDKNATSSLNIAFEEFMAMPLTSDFDLSSHHANTTTVPNQATAAQLISSTCGSRDTNNPFVITPKRANATAIVAEHDRITSLWRAWLIAETVRRIYITAVYMQCVYMTLKRGAAGPYSCPGGMSFTARSGLWDAPSAYSWFRQVQAAADQNGNSRSSSLLMVQTNDMWKVIDEATPRDVDEFTKAIVLICFGKEWITERWFGEDED